MKDEKGNFIDCLSPLSDFRTIIFTWSNSMNIEQAKTIPIAEFLDKLNIKPEKTRGQQAIYLSPIRNERTASFNVHTGQNLWFDHGLGSGGDIITLAQKYLQNVGEPSTVPDALRFIENITGNAPRIVPVVQPEGYSEDPRLSITGLGKIEHRGLIRYLASRGISLEKANRYFQQVKVHNKNSGKFFYSLGHQNDEDGHELRSEFFKGCIGSKSVTFIRGCTDKPDGIHVFEGYFDFLSILETRNLSCLKEDTIILNSLSMLETATPYIKGYGYKIAYTWIDNDPAGEKAVKALDEFFKTEEYLKHRPMNDVYKSYKDVNDWHMKKLSL